MEIDKRIKCKDTIKLKPKTKNSLNNDNVTLDNSSYVTALQIGKALALYNKKQETKSKTKKLVK